MLICIVGKKLTNNFAEKTAEKRRAKFDAYLKVMSKIIYPTIQEEYFHWNLNFAILLMANSLNSNSAFY